MLPLWFASITRLATLLAIISLPSFRAYRASSALSRGMSVFRRMDPNIQMDVVSYLQCAPRDDVEAIHDGNNGVAGKFDYQIKKAKKKHFKEISKLCVETFLGDGDDWLHINKEKQNVARDLTKRSGGLYISYFPINGYDLMYISPT